MYIHIFYTIIGVCLNLLLITGFFKRKNKTYQKYTLPMMSLLYQLNLIVFVISNTRLNSSSRLFINYSTFTCKTFTFILHVTSSCTTWLFSMFLFVIKCYLYKNVKCLERIHFVYFLLILKLCLINSIDFFYVDLNTIESNENQTHHNRVCTIRDFRVLLVRDIIDFLFYFLLPFFILVFNIFQLRPMQKLNLYPQMKCVFHVFFIFFFAPKICVILVNDLLVLTKNDTKHVNIVLEWIFTLATMINGSFVIGGVIMHAYFNLITRMVCFKIFCFPCYLVNIFHEIEKLKEEEEEVGKSYSPMFEKF